MNYLDMIDSQTFIGEADVYISQLEMFQKQILMEQTAPDPGNTANIGTAPDPVSKWQQFVNWITRLIMKLRTFFMSKKVEKRIGKLEAAHRYLSDNQKDTYSVPSYVDDIFIKHAPEHKTGQNVIWEEDFSISKGIVYQRNAKNAEKEIEDLRRASGVFANGDSEKINISKKQFVIAIKNITDVFDFAKQFINQANIRIKSLKENLSDDDRKSPAFQQYVNCLTKGIQKWFYFMKFINKTLLWIMEDENIFTATLDGKYSNDAGGGISGLYDAVAISAMKAKITREQVKSYKTIYVFLKDNDMLVAFSNAKDVKDTSNMKVVNLTLASHYDYNTLPDQAIKQLKNRDIYALDSDEDRERIISRMPK